MATYITDTAICLRVTDFSETSQIVGMFTREHGLVPLIAKGAKRTSKKNTMSGPLDLLTSGEVVFVPAKEQRGAPGGGQGAQLGTLAAWELANHQQKLRSNLAGLNAGMLCAEVTTHLVQPHDPHPELFDELCAALSLVGEGPKHSRAMLAYLKAALLAAGYWPQLGTCLCCGKPIGDAPVRFSPRAGGILCGQASSGCHIEHEGTTLVVPGRIIAALDRLDLPTALLTRQPERAGDPNALAVAAQMLLTHIEAITDKQIRTASLVRSIFGIRK